MFKKSGVFAAVAAALLMVAMPAQAEVQKTAEVIALEKRASKGDAKAQLDLVGFYNKNGDKKLAAEWLEKAALGGYDVAQYRLGNAYRYGSFGKKRDGALAGVWYTKAAEQGHADAQLSLSILYSMGDGGKRDYVQARYWAEKGLQHPDDQFSDKSFKYAVQAGLGVMYVSGQGGSIDFDKARYWGELAARNGNSIGQYLLGTLYELGLGVQRDYVKARYWYGLAAAQGLEDAAKHLNELRAKGY